MILDELYKIIEERKERAPDNSYVSRLMKSGNDRVVQKVGEEAVETVIAAKNNNKKEIISETADLFFHILIMLSVLGIKPDDVYRELEKRRGK